MSEILIIYIFSIYNTQTQIQHIEEGRKQEKQPPNSWNMKSAQVNKRDVL